MRDRERPRFFVPGVAVPGSTVAITGQDARHILRVLRLGPGDEIAAVDGAGIEHRGLIAAARADEVLVVLAEGSDVCREPSVFITIVQGLPKGDKMDEVVRKNTEIGVSRFVPVVTERTVARPDQAGAAKRLERWRRIAREASRQSGRQRVPDVLAIESFLDAVRRTASMSGSGEGAPGSRLVLMPWELERSRGIRDVVKGCSHARDIVILIGPEGGFSREEVAQAVELGAVTCGLGPRILRTETAGLVVASIVLYEAGEMG
ncbi:MAG: 16S rRNA (uracil(1498)-N(3))-methyltransferase [Firmicutes bacterium]|jgi:16S rRNA (uracil1498-N3)-methyltransferase|nr:16S rRNA (uracil(1498)-N(3))-methyltransferase [Bacillota bacterium]MDH7495011.1 16S rRNA (uracil(1498)-N(3))-methyltransferase [Bacillota bacterium]